MKKKIIILLIFSFLLYDSVSAESCSTNGFSVVTINGVFTSGIEAKKNKENLRQFLPLYINNEPIVVNYLHNQTHLAGAGDMIEYIRQGFFDQKSDFDLTEILMDAHKEIKTQKVLLVAHSQGNFYANNFYDHVVDKSGGIPKESLAVYAVATPTNHVSGEGNYITSDTDRVITGLVSGILLRPILPPNTHIQLQKGDDINGHSFSDVYLKYKGREIVSEIESSLSHLESNALQKTDSSCISAPELSKAHTFQKAILSVADPIAYGISSIFGGLYDGIVFVSNTGSRIAGSVSNTSKNNPASAGSLVYDAHDDQEDVSFTEENNSFSDDTQEDSIEESDVVYPTPDPITPFVKPLVTVPNTISFVGGSGSGSGGTHSGTTTGTGTSGSSVISGSTSGGTTTNGTTSGGTTTTSGTGTGGASSGTTTSAHPTPADTIPPVISLIGNSSITIYVGDTYTDPGATALDAVDGTVSISVSGNVHTATVGTYTVSYTASDTAGNSSTVTRTVIVVTHPSSIGKGHRKNFDINNHIVYTGDFVICDIDNRSVLVHGNNGGVTSFISSTNWQMPGMQTVNNAMNRNIHYRFIFGSSTEATNDCVDGTHVNDYSNSFYYKTVMGDSIVYDPDSLNHIESFEFPNLDRTITILDNPPYEISVYVPGDVDLTHLTPSIATSPGASISPRSNVSKNFTNPITYMVTSADGFDQEYTVTVIPSLGKKLNFDAQNKIQFMGQFIVCAVDTHTVTASGDNIAISNFISSTNWQTAGQQTPNSNMATNITYRFIFGSRSQTSLDCTNNTYLNDYSQQFYYAHSSGSSVVYGAYTGSENSSSAKSITSFNLVGTPGASSAGINTTSYTVSITVPFGTDVTNRAPSIGVSNGATVSPASGVVQNFTNPVSYTVTAHDGSTQVYTVLVTVLPQEQDGGGGTPGAPTLTSSMLNGGTTSITVDPVTHPITLSLTASENVNWLSIKIENQDDSTIYKMFFSGSECADGTSTCTKSWDGDLSSGGVLQNNTIYRIKVHMKDEENNDYDEYLSSTIQIRL